MYTQPELALGLVAVGLFAFSGCLLRLLKQAVDRRWPRDLVGSALSTNQTEPH
jgi:hypothetical protein